MKNMQIERMELEADEIEQAMNLRRESDESFYFVLIISGVFLLVVIATCIVCLYKANLKMRNRL